MDGRKEEKKEGRKQWKKVENVLFNDTLNTFYLQLFVVRHMVKDHLDSKMQNQLLPIHGWMDGRKKEKKEGRKQMCI